MKHLFAIQAMDTVKMEEQLHYGYANTS